jgi:Kef-type K+ transport system membrane component KefB
MDHSAEQIMRLVIQLAAILIAAKLAGELFERFLKMPAVLGELAAGIVIGPFALGGVDFPFVGALFEHVPALSHEEDLNPIAHIPEPLWAIAQVGSIVLLFIAGLETDLRQFLRYARPATLVAIGGVVLPFVFGDVLTVVFGYAESFGDVKALFIGAVMTATSIGITVRVMSDLRRLGTPEGVTILGAAVLDDVVGILILTVVVALANTGDVSVGSIGFIAFKTIGFWLALTGIGILASKHIARLLQSLKVSGAPVALSLALALLAAGLAESFGLAMIIGAFSIGLALSDTDLAHNLEKPLMAVYAALVPIFFVVMGMLVDLSAMGGVIGFGVLLTALAVIGKVAGSGLPALLVGFNRRGSWRVGVGMLPRGEVALIMAGIGVSNGVLDSDLYGVAIFMTIVTTALAPPILAFSFKSGESGLRSPAEQAQDG